MALWNKLRDELDRAGRAAQVALDEGKVRLELFRVRQLADKAAQALGYALHDARKAGNQLDEATYARFAATLAEHEANIARYEREISEHQQRRGADGDDAVVGAATPDARAEPAVTPTAPPDGAGTSGGPNQTPDLKPHGDPLTGHTPTL